MHNPHTEAIVKLAGRIIDHKMYELASKLEDELWRARKKVSVSEEYLKAFVESYHVQDWSDSTCEEIEKEAERLWREERQRRETLSTLKSDNEALRNQLALERKHLTASGRYTNT